MRDGNKSRHWLRVGMALSFAVLGGCQAPAQPQQTVATEYGLGPDKWASAWLMARQAVPGAALAVVAQGKPLPAGIAFDVPASPLRRERDHAAFQSIVEHYRLTDPDLARMATIVRDIEVNYWGDPDAAESPEVEHAFRELQQRHGRYAVSPECYLRFFDKVYTAIQTQRQQGTPMAADALRVDCHQLASDDAQGALVPEVPIATVLSEITAGKSVVFVDVREPEEFVEAHIPGAMNVQLRALDDSVLAKLRGADYVVAYCIKDFRGFEMARSLRDAGIGNAVILKPYGIKGWIEEGLPTTGRTAMPEAQARERLATCVQAPQGCREDAARAKAAQGAHR